MLFTAQGLSVELIAWSHTSEAASQINKAFLVTRKIWVTAATTIRNTAYCSIPPLVLRLLVLLSGNNSNSYYRLNTLIPAEPAVAQEEVVSVGVAVVVAAVVVAAAAAPPPWQHDLQEQRRGPASATAS